MPMIERNLDRLLEYASPEEKEILLRKGNNDPLLKKTIAVVKMVIATRVRNARMIYNPDYS